MNTSTYCVVAILLNENGIVILLLPLVALPRVIVANAGSFASICRSGTSRLSVYEIRPEPVAVKLIRPVPVE